MEFVGPFQNGAARALPMRTRGHHDERRPLTAQCDLGAGPAEHASAVEAVRGVGPH